MKKFAFVFLFALIPAHAFAYTWYMGSPTYQCVKASYEAEKLNEPALSSPRSALVWAKTRAYRYYDHWERKFPGVGVMMAIKMQPTSMNNVTGFVWFSSKPLCDAMMKVLEKKNG